MLAAGFEDLKTPADITAEAALIACILTDHDCEETDDAVRLIPDERHFWNDTHRAFWRVILEKHRGGQSVDLVTIDAALAAHGVSFDAAMGPSHDLTILGRMMVEQPLGYHAEAYAYQILNASIARDLIEIAENVNRECRRKRITPGEIASQATERLRNLDTKTEENIINAKDLVGSVMCEIFDRSEGKTRGIMTPFDVFNWNTGGFQPQDLVVIAARPSMGKTSFALNLVSFVSITHKIPSVFVSLEMGNPLLVERVLACRSQIDAMKLRRGQLGPEEWQALGVVKRQIGEGKMNLVRRPGKSLSQVCGEIRRAKQKFGVKLAVVDYAQLIRDPGKQSEYESLTRTATDLKGLANDLDIPILLLSQLNRELEKRDDKRPKESDLRGSGAIEEAADLVIFLHRPERFDPNDRKGICEILIPKARNAPPCSFDLFFDAITMRFSDVAIPIADLGQPPERNNSRY